MSSSRALCSRSASCIGSVTAARQRRVSLPFITAPAVPEASRQVHDDAFADAFSSRRTSGTAPPPKSKSPSKRQKPANDSRFGAPEAATENESAVGIFHSVVRGRKNNGTINEGQVSDISLTAILRRVAKQDMPPRKRADFFLNDVWPQIKAQGRPLPKHLLVEVNAALKSVTNALLSDPGYKQIQYGHLTGIASAHVWLGTNDVAALSGLITGLCFLIVKAPTPRISQMSSKGAARITPATPRNPELLQLWTMLSNMNRASAPKEDSEQRVQLIMPKVEDIVHSTRNLDKATGAELALAFLLNQFPANTGKQAFPAIMATLMVLLHYAPTSLLPHWTPLLDPARHILKEFPIDEMYLRQRFANELLIPPISQGVLARAVANRWNETYDIMTSEHPVWQSTGGQQTRFQRPSKARQGQLYGELKAAHQSHNSGILIGLWKELLDHIERSDTLADELRDPESTYLDYWHFVWCANKQSHMVSEVQALMRKLGLEPNIKTYTSMMHGWKLSRQNDKINMLWDTLRNNGYKLDTYIWTERISGLIELGEVQKGINTLGEMLALWRKAVEDNEEDKAVPVTISVINAAFKPLIRKDRHAAFKILQWAGEEGIKPDVVTYNVLINECFRKSESPDDVSNLLAAMKSEGIEPDGATFTIILEGACRDLHHATAEEQVVAVNQVIDDINKAGIKLSLETWGKILHTVATLPSGSDAAINTVLDHARKAGFQKISPHMVHILIKRIADTDGGKPEAIEKVLLENGYRDVTSGDQRLWEEVISAYSYLGDGKRAVAVYDDLKKMGRKLDRQFASRDLLHALLKSDDRENAKRLVDDMLENVRAEEHHNDRVFRHNFWNRAYSEGLLDWDKAPDALKGVVDPGKAAAEGLEHKGHTLYSN